MAWVKLDDQFHDHPKVLEVGPLAEALYVRGLTYAARYLTDGFIPEAHLRRMGDMDALEAADKLVGAGLWDVVDKGFQIHDYLDYQPSADKVKAEREAARSRMSRARSAKPEPNISERSDEVRANIERSSHNPVPYPSRPVPDQEVPDGTSGSDAPAAPTPEPKPARQGKSTRQRATRIPEDFEVTEAMRSWALRQPGVTAEFLEHETEKFRDHWSSSPKTQLDWPATWRNWIRRALEGFPVRGAPIPIRPQFGAASGQRPKTTAERLAEKALRLEAQGQ